MIHSSFLNKKYKMQEISLRYSFRYLIPGLWYVLIFYYFLFNNEGFVNYKPIGKGNDLSNIFLLSRL